MQILKSVFITPIGGRALSTTTHQIPHPNHLPNVNQLGQFLTSCDALDVPEKSGADEQPKVSFEEATKLLNEVNKNKIMSSENRDHYEDGGVRQAGNTNGVGSSRCSDKTTIADIQASLGEGDTNINAWKE